MEKNEFLKRFSLTEERLEMAQITADQLMSIYDIYCSKREALITQAEAIVRQIREIPEIHSIKYRIKDADHLIEKIIRKKIDKPSREITPENFVGEITDLIGIRALHLYKEDWRPINAFIIRTWALKSEEKVTAYVRHGDDTTDVAGDCEVKIHDRGYRSIHYIIEFQPTKEKITAEIQVRSLFEEAWSEIDHQIAYPNHSSDPVLLEYLRVFNAIAGCADQMGSFIRYLQLALLERQQKAQSEIDARESKLNDINEKLNQLSEANERDTKEKETLQSIVNGLKQELKRAQRDAAVSNSFTGGIGQVSTSAAITNALRGIYFADNSVGIGNLGTSAAVTNALRGFDFADNVAGIRNIGTSAAVTNALRGINLADNAVGIGSLGTSAAVSNALKGITSADKVLGIGDYSTSAMVTNALKGKK